MDKYISREAIIEELEEEIAMGDEFDEKDVLINKGLKIALKYIKRQPASNVQPVRHGRWVECCNELDKKCSCCDKVHGTIYEREPFCPNCGARMDGDK